MAGVLLLTTLAGYGGLASGVTYLLINADRDDVDISRLKLKATLWCILGALAGLAVKRRVPAKGAVQDVGGDGLVPLPAVRGDIQLAGGAKERRQRPAGASDCDMAGSDISADRRIGGMVFAKRAEGRALHDHVIAC